MPGTGRIRLLKTPHDRSTQLAYWSALPLSLELSPAVKTMSLGLATTRAAVACAFAMEPVTQMSPAPIRAGLPAAGATAEPTGSGPTDGTGTAVSDQKAQEPARAIRTPRIVVTNTSRPARPRVANVT